MKHGIILTVGIGSGVFIWLLSLAQGYFVDPTLLEFGFPFIPLGLPLALTAVLVPIGYCVWLLFARKTRRNIGFTLAALIGPLVLVVGPGLLNGYDAFIYRMKGFSEPEYQRLAADIKTAFDERGVNKLMSYDIYLLSNDIAVYESLVDSHPILAISEFPLDIEADDEEVSLEWASGLTGGYQVLISLSSDPPSEWAGPSGPGLPGPFSIDRTYIYDGVALLRRW